MTTRIYVDGTITDDAHARVPVLDRGFLYGDGIYEVVRTSGGVAVDLAPHLDRLDRSAARLRIELPARATIEAAIAATLADAGNPESYVRIIVTRGDGEFGLDPALSTQARLVIIVRALSLPADEVYQRGVAARIVSVERTSPRALDPAIKSGNYLNNILGLGEAKRAGANEAILLDASGRVAEGASSNVWCVRDGQVATPPLNVGLLPGITRWRLLQLAAADGVPVAEVELVAGDLHTADEIFLTSSIRGVLPVSRLDERELPVGPLTRRLIGLYERFLDPARR